jgi:hypothetical protein
MSVMTKLRRAGIRAARLRKETAHDAARVRRELALKRKVPEAVIESRRQSYLRAYERRMRELLSNDA